MRRTIRAALVAALLPLVAGSVLMMARPAAAASLTQVTNFGNNPTNLNMYVYVPANVAPRPALLVLVHYCGGSASSIFGWNGKDYVTAADRYGYVIVLPEATRSEKCFDVSTPPALRRDGGGDSTSIMSMVGYARSHYNVDPARIVVSGFSSGAMMTNVLAAQYPDVFAAASAFSGVPAGCFATTNGSLWNSTCSGGNLIKTAQQWGDLARSMYPGYAGRYPRMQLWHGTTDTTLAYPNFGEEIKQWTNLHGLSQTPGFTDHPQSTWTRTRYGTVGTQATVEGVSIAGVGHDLPQAGQLAYAISFLGLDGGTGGGNLLANGTMESGTNDWAPFGSATLSSVTGTAHGGTRALLVNGRTAAWNGPGQAVTSKLTNGRSYTTTVWARTQSGTSTLKTTLAVTANGTTSYVRLTPDGAVSANGWTQLSGTATVSWSGTLSSATLYVESTSGTSSFLIDDASLQ